MSTTKDSIRILSLVPYKVFPAIMGGQKGIALFYKYLSQQVELNVITTQKNEANESYQVKNILTNSQVRYISPSIFFLLKKEAKQTNSAHLLFEHPYFAWLILLFKWFTSYKVIVHSHNIESERFRSVGKWWWKILWFYERMAYRMADYVWFKTNEDLTYAIDQYKLDLKKCEVIPYGIEMDLLPSEKEIENSKNVIQQLYHIPKEEKIFLFNGTLNYKPNLDALKHILDDINPLLMTSGIKYKIIVCGKNLPTDMNELKAYVDQHIIYAGFVDDIDLYFKACDVFLNPLLDGGGIKTKLVEALGFGKAAVSSLNGAIGVDEACTQGRLTIIADHDWQGFASSIIEKASKEISNDNNLFYQTFAWKNIAIKAKQCLSK